MSNCGNGCCCSESVTPETKETRHFTCPIFKAVLCSVLFLGICSGAYAWIQYSEATRKAQEDTLPALLPNKPSRIAPAQ